AAYSVIECGHGFFQRRFGIRSVMIEDIHVVDAHPTKTLIETGGQIFFLAPFSVRTRPQQITCLGRDNKFISIFCEVVPKNGAKCFFSRSRRGTIIVGQIEMSDSQIKCSTKHRSRVLKRVNASKVMPKPERNRRQV